jgi:hypothetical protein
MIKENFFRLKKKHCAMIEKAKKRRLPKRVIYNMNKSLSIKQSTF